LPLMVNGKVDRTALPEPHTARRPARPHAAPTTPVEEVLAEIWQQVLRVDEIGIDDNFFDLGGNSLSATKLMALLSERFQVEVSLRKLFLTPTIRGFAEVVDAALLESIQQLSEEQAREMSLGLSV
jgi:acyl carrier protein